MAVPEAETAFLKEIESWRAALVQSLALRNAGLNRRDLNIAAQRTIDRVVFLRICEDRGVEPYGRLLALQEGDNVYEKLCQSFCRAEDRYKSGLFRFQPAGEGGELPDLLSLTLAIDDKPLKDIIGSLYDPDSPYGFSVLPADILGQIYERFLGRTIRVAPGRGAVVEERPEARKARGVYYTPGYIVDYIVRNTLGKLLAGKTPREAARLSVLDPACGSGSFLIGAYQYLLDWHKDQYVAIGPEKHPKELYQRPDGSWRLTISERERILLSSVYGVDADPQAVETTKLSLMLKMLEGEAGEVLGRTPRMFRERALPDLGQNIKGGNSLVSPAYLHGRQMSLLDEESYQAGVFDWKREFPRVSSGKGAGFDAVIGNPPYGADLSDRIRKYLARDFGAGTTDTAALMMLQALKLTKRGGWNGFIVPKPFTYSSNWRQVRDRLLDELQELVDAGKVWQEVKLEQVVYIVRKGARDKHYRCSRREGRDVVYLGEIPKSECKRFGFYVNGIDEDELRVGRAVAQAGHFLGDFTTNTRGGALQGVLSRRPDGRRAIGGKQLRRFAIQGEKGYVEAGLTLQAGSLVGPGSILVQNIVAHIARPAGHVKIAGTVVEAGEAEGIAIVDTVNQLTNQSDMSSKYLLAILLSRLTSWYVYRFIFAKAVRTMHFDGPVTDRIPIRQIDFADPVDRARHDDMVALVDRMLELHKAAIAAGTSSDGELLRRRIDETDRLIDRLVYELYELTEEDIRVIQHPLM